MVLRVPSSVANSRRRHEHALLEPSQNGPTRPGPLRPDPASSIINPRNLAHLVEKVRPSRRAVAR